MNEPKMCLLERFFRNNGFKLVHDGQKNPGQFQFSPEEVRYYTRKYRLQIDHEWQNTWVVFKYDERSQFADFEIYSREPNNRGREKMVMQRPPDIAEIPEVEESEVIIK